MPSDGTPNGVFDAFDRDTGTWWRLRMLTPSELVESGVTALAMTPTMEEPQDDPALPSTPSLRVAQLSERLIASAVSAVCAVPAELHDAAKARRADLDAACAALAAARTLADRGGDAAGLEQLAEAERIARQAHGAAVAAVDAWTPADWRPIAIRLADEPCGPGDLSFRDLPQSVAGTVAQALSARRASAGDRLRSFLGA